MTAEQPTTSSGPPAAGPRPTNVRDALLAAGVDMARSGGPEAVVLRAATRAVGVVPNAAYRHFRDRDALLVAVSQFAMSRLAAAMEDEQGGATGRDPRERARARIRGVGAGYLRFARSEPGLFRTAFGVPDHLGYAEDGASAGPSGRTPYQLLADALDEVTAVGLVPQERRPGAELLAWSAVHGLAMLVLDGPLRSLPPEDYGAVGDQLLAFIDRGLAADPD